MRLRRGFIPWENRQKERREFYVCQRKVRRFLSVQETAVRNITRKEKMEV